MPIKFVALRSHDGHATDPTRPKAKVKTGVGGFFQILATDKADAFRVSVDGVQLAGNPAKWPADKKPGKADILIEQIVDDAVVHSIRGEVEIIGPAIAAPDAGAKAENAAAE